MTARLRAVPAARLHLFLMLVLTFTTGINDAVGYLGLDKVFTGNMTGNVVVLGMALVGGTGLPTLGPALALVGFMAGAAVGGRALKRVTGAWSRGVTVLLACVAILMLVLAAVLFAVGDDPAHGLVVSVTTGAAVAMGLQAATARHVAVQDVTTVVVTSTITGLAADSILGGGSSVRSARRFLAVALILLGAAVGALLLKVHLGAGLLLAGVVIAVVTVVGALHPGETEETAA
ncbi:YoaK family protein [Nocardioides panacisoli]|uniref:YoaK family protein n=1 Tax=Nocardioides panacisoli TaxID=627624 RepID=UPI0031D97E0A